MKIAPDYFLDAMSFTEAGLLVEKRNEMYRESWEKQRWGWYISALTAGAKLDSPQDLVKFTWEKDKKREEVDPKARDQRKAAMLKAYSDNKPKKPVTFNDLSHHGKI